MCKTVVVWLRRKPCTYDPKRFSNKNALFCHTKRLLGLRMPIFATDLKAWKQGPGRNTAISGKQDCRPAPVKVSPAAEKPTSARKSCSPKETPVAIRPGRVLKHGFHSIRTQYTRADGADRLACMLVGLGWQVGWAGKLARLAGLAGKDGWLGGKTFGFDYCLPGTLWAPPRSHLILDMLACRGSDGEGRVAARSSPPRPQARGERAT